MGGVAPYLESVAYLAINVKLTNDHTPAVSILPSVPVSVIFFKFPIPLLAPMPLSKKRNTV
jgi:hypothetical protein